MKQLYQKAFNFLGAFTRQNQEPPLPWSPPATAPVYQGDGLYVWRKNVQFLEDPKFRAAYSRGMNSGHKIGRQEGSCVDVPLEWRVHVICWAAFHAAQLPGDFVECGVNTGIFSLAAAHYLDFAKINKRFYLFDTYCGIPSDQMSDRERPLAESKNRRIYGECYETACRNFAPFPNAILVRGVVPDTLSTVPIDRVCYLSLDMNIAAPEAAAIRYFWDKLVPGAPVILDDYGCANHDSQKEALDAFAASVGCRILTLPTGQGLLLKPPTL